ncbi:hypothetical protein [Methylobacterium nodulans]|nr:hypothetical protein [Methylobacterium nodulans]
MLSEMAATSGRYVFATSRIALFEERVRDLRQQAEHYQTNPTIRVLHHQSSDLSINASVVSEIEDAPRIYKDQEHIVLFITHEGMMAADLDGFVGWHIYIDESPAAVSSAAFKVPATATYLDAAYDLEPSSKKGWFKVVPKPSAPDKSAIINDEFLSGLATFHKRARSSQGVFVNVSSWTNVIGSHKPLQWWSAWTPAELGAFASVTIAGSGYRHSIGYKATQTWCPDQVDFVFEEVKSPARARAKVRVHFLARHRGSTTFWKGAGRACLVKAARYLATIPNIGYWATNTDFELSFEAAGLSGERVSPRQEGTNTLIHHTCCALIYSSKAVPSDGPILEVFGLKKSDIERAREVEDIVQFVLRGALRRPDFDGTYEVYLYEEHQANMLKTYLEQEGIADVELVAVDEAGILDVQRPKSGRPRIQLDESSKAERVERRRESDKRRKRRERAAEKQRRQKNGTYRGRGRP